MRFLVVLFALLAASGCASIVERINGPSQEGGKNCYEIERMCRLDCDDKDDRGACEFDCFNDRLLCNSQGRD